MTVGVQVEPKVAVAVPVAVGVHGRVAGLLRVELEVGMREAVGDAVGDAASAESAVSTASLAHGAACARPGKTSSARAQIKARMSAFPPIPQGIFCRASGALSAALPGPA